LLVLLLLSHLPHPLLLLLVCSQLKQKQVGWPNPGWQ
jgi:hypothetical protein